jgi:hypothetical protein
MKSFGLGKGDRGKIIFAADLAAFEIYRKSFDQWIGGMGATERGPGCEGGDHFYGFNSKRASGVARRVAASEHDPSHLALRNGSVSDLAKRGA